MNPKIIVIVGPTAAGKSAVALHLAEKFNGEIINADSRQIYKELDIGTGKPSPLDTQKIPHHLFDICSLNDMADASFFRMKADAVIREMASRGRHPVVVGGTGLYVKSLLFGFFKGPSAQPKIRKRLEEQIKEDGVAALHAALAKIDAVSASKIHRNDPARIIRALEVYEITGSPISSYHREHRFQEVRYPYLKIGIRVDRLRLHAEIAKRVELMIEKGLEGEVKKLWEKYGEHPVLCRTIGYKEWFPYFEGHRAIGEVIESIIIHTRQFARRQETWFRKEKDIVWFAREDLQEMGKKVREFLA